MNDVGMLRHCHSNWLNPVGDLFVGKDMLDRVKVQCLS